jgi:hypothetical protein
LFNYLKILDIFRICKKNILILLPEGGKFLCKLFIFLNKFYPLLPRLIPKARVFRLRMKAISNPRVKKNSVLYRERYGVYSKIEAEGMEWQPPSSGKKEV